MEKYDRAIKSDPKNHMVGIRALFVTNVSRSDAVFKREYESLAVGSFTFIRTLRLSQFILL